MAGPERAATVAALISLIRSTSESSADAAGPFLIVRKLNEGADRNDDRDQSGP